MSKRKNKRHINKREFNQLSLSDRKKAKNGELFIINELGQLQSFASRFLR